jgi:hypothetical protein
MGHLRAFSPAVRWRREVVDEGIKVFDGVNASATNSPEARASAITPPVPQRVDIDCQVFRRRLAAKDAGADGEGTVAEAFERSLDCLLDDSVHIARCLAVPSLVVTNLVAKSRHDGVLLWVGAVRR